MFYNEQGHLQLDQAAQSPVQPDLVSRFNPSAGNWDLTATSSPLLCPPSRMGRKWKKGKTCGFRQRRFNKTMENINTSNNNNEYAKQYKTHFFLTPQPPIV